MLADAASAAGRVDHHALDLAVGSALGGRLAGPAAHGAGADDAANASARAHFPCDEETHLGCQQFIHCKDVIGFGRIQRGQVAVQRIEQRQHLGLIGAFAADDGLGGHG